MVENLNSFYEEQGVVRLENGKVRRMPLAEREAWCAAQAPFWSACGARNPSSSRKASAFAVIEATQACLKAP